MPIEIRNPADPAGIMATCDEASAGASNCHIVHQEAFLPALSGIAYGTVTPLRVSPTTSPSACHPALIPKAPAFWNALLTDAACCMSACAVSPRTDCRLPPSRTEQADLLAERPLGHPIPYHRALGQSPGQRVRAH